MKKLPHKCLSNSTHGVEFALLVMHYQTMHGFFPSCHYCWGYTRKITGLKLGGTREA